MCFQELHLDQALVREAQLPRVQDVKYGHILAVVAEVPDALECLARFLEQVGDQHHKSAALYDLRDLVQRVFDIALTLRVRSE